MNKVDWRLENLLSLKHCCRHWHYHDGVEIFRDLSVFRTGTSHVRLVTDTDVQDLALGVDCPSAPERHIGNVPGFFSKKHADIFP